MYRAPAATAAILNPDVILEKAYDNYQTYKRPNPFLDEEDSSFIPEKMRSAIIGRNKPAPQPPASLFWTLLDAIKDCP